MYSHRDSRSGNRDPLPASPAEAVASQKRPVNPPARPINCNASAQCPHPPPSLVDILVACFSAPLATSPCSKHSQAERKGQKSQKKGPAASAPVAAPAAGAAQPRAAVRRPAVLEPAPAGPAAVAASAPRPSSGPSGRTRPARWASTGGTSAPARTRPSACPRALHHRLPGPLLLHRLVLLLPQPPPQLHGAPAQPPPGARPLVRRRPAPPPLRRPPRRPAWPVCASPPAGTRAAAALVIPPVVGYLDLQAIQDGRARALRYVFPPHGPRPRRRALSRLRPLQQSQAAAARRRPAPGPLLRRRAHRPGQERREHDAEESAVYTVGHLSQHVLDNRRKDGKRETEIEKRLTHKSRPVCSSPTRPTAGCCTCTRPTSPRPSSTAWTIPTAPCPQTSTSRHRHPQHVLPALPHAGLAPQGGRARRHAFGSCRG